MKIIKSILLFFLLVCFASCTKGNEMEDALEAYQKRDYQTAYEIYLLHALRGNPSAQNQLGMMHYWGQGMPHSYSEAASWLKLAAEQGNMSAAYWLGAIYRDEKGGMLNYPEAVKWWRMAVEQGKGLPDKLGELYEKGLGAPQDFKEALRLYRIGAERYDRIAFVHLGRMYEKGQGVPQDYRKAMEWYRKGGTARIPFAHQNVARMYEEGLGVPKDLVEAYSWYSIAINHRSSLGPFDREGIRKSLDRVKSQLTAAQRSQAKAKAARWGPTPRRG